MRGYSSAGMGIFTCKWCCDDGWEKVCTLCMTSSMRTRVPAPEDMIHHLLEKEHHESKCLFVSRCSFSECTMFEKPLCLSLFRNHTISCHSDQFKTFTFDHNINSQWTQIGIRFCRILTEKTISWWIVRRAASEICVVSHISQRPHNLEKHLHTEWMSL